MVSPALMLASSSRDLAATPEAVIRVLQARGDWSFELKQDGVRGLIRLGDRVTITNRTGIDIGYRYPDVVSSLTDTGTRCVLDGELVVLDDAGRSLFAAIHRRDSVGSEQAARSFSLQVPVTFAAFDLLAVDGVDLRMSPYIVRRQRLMELSEQLLGRLFVPPSSDAGMAMWSLVKRRNLEGLVAKHKGSRYVGRRSPDWRKIRKTRRLTALVAGFQPGEGSRSETFGALDLTLWDPEANRLTPIGQVGSGFSDNDLTELWGRLSRGEHPLMVDIEYLERSRSGNLRNPVFKGIRLDISPIDCSVDQFEQ